MIDDNAAAQTMFGGSPIHGDAQREIARSAMEGELATPQQAAQRSEAWGTVFSGLGLNATESARLAGLKTDATPEQREAWREDSRKALTQDYGPEGAGQALRDTQAYIAKHPELRQFLSKTGLGDHPQWVRTVAAKAREARKAGKL